MRWTSAAILLMATQLISAEDQFDAVETWVREIRQQSPYDVSPGITALVVSPAGTRVFGDGEQTLGGRAADADSLMEIGSLSKTMTGLGIASLVSAGKMHWCV